MSIHNKVSEESGQLKVIINVIKKPGFIVFGIIALTFIFMRLDINPLMNRISSALISTDYYVRYDLYSNNPHYYSNPNISYIICNENDGEYININWRFNKFRNGPEKNSDTTKAVLKMSPIFAFHNFFDGYVWFGYEVHYYDKNGIDIGGSISRWPYLTKMKIHRVSLTWQVVDVDEHP